MALAEEYGLVVANVFHAGDGNLHPLVCYDGAVEGEAERAEELSGRILDVCLEAGGSITGEHGVGIDKKKHMPKMFGEADLDAFQRLRCAFDPAGLANPGKVMPTPRLCGEVPGPLPPASARSGGPGGPLLMTVEEAAAEIREHAAAGHAVRPRGRRHEARLGRRRREAIDFDTRRLNRILEHNEGDFTAILEAGVPLVEAQAAFGAAGQMLALDPPLGADAAATIGGVIAANDSGPMRHRYGSVRDLVVGITVVLSDGTIAKSGGKVIKNVAGYDLAKLFAGSFGTLGLIARVAVRLHPAPPRTATVTARERRPGRARQRGRHGARRAAARGGLPRRRLAGRRRLARPCGSAAPRRPNSAEAASQRIDLSYVTIEDEDDDEALGAPPRAPARAGRDRREGLRAARPTCRR